MQITKLIKFLAITIIFLTTVNVINAQLDSGIKQIATFNSQTYYGSNPATNGDASGNGRFLVFESNQNIATHNPRNADLNWEIFLMDYAQRHIFQITDTKHALRNINISPTQQENILVRIVNNDAVISDDGRSIAFSSNATTSLYNSPPNGTNPGNFDGNGVDNNGIPLVQPLQQDGNGEVWLYKLPLFQEVSLETGETPSFVNLEAGTFTQVTNSIASGVPRGGTTTQPSSVSMENREPSINDNGSTIAFSSNRNLDLIVGNSDQNVEVFVYKQIIGQPSVISQTTKTPIGSFLNPRWSASPSISGDGNRVAFISNATNPINNMIGGCNEDFNEQIYFSDLNELGEPEGVKRQITYAPRPPGGAVIVIIYAKSKIISRDGRYVIFSSRAKHTGDLSLEDPYKFFVYDSNVALPTPVPTQCTLRENANQFRQVGPTFNSDPVLGVQGGISAPKFTDYTGQIPSSIVFQSRMNFRADGSIPPLNVNEGLNPSASRPNQIFAYSLSSPAVYSRLTNSQNIAWGAATRVYPTNKKERIYFSTLTTDYNSVSLFHLLLPSVTVEDTNTQLTFMTGASGLSITGIPQQAQGLAPGMLGSVVFSSPNISGTQGYATNVSNSRKFSAPLQMKAVSVTIDGISAGVTGVTNGQVNFIVPSVLQAGLKTVVINYNGVILRGNIQINGYSQPDILTRYRDNIAEIVPAPYGRARVFNVTDPNNPLPEPFRVTTQTPNGIMPTKLRIFLTGVQGVAANSIIIKLGTVTIPTNLVLTNAVESDYPGVYTFDFEVPSQLNVNQDLPVQVTVIDNGGQSSRPIETASKVRFKSTQAQMTDLAVWRPSSGAWYILDNNGANQIGMNWGTTSDIIAPGDYDGDGKTDFCVFRPSEGNWYVYKSSTNTLLAYAFGQAGDKVAQADYDGDGKTDFAVFRPSDGNWYMVQSSNNQIVGEFLGVYGDKLTPADFDGDGKADLAVWKNRQASFWVKGTVQNTVVETLFGQSGDKPVIGDYDGDGRADFATWRSSDNTWRILNSGTNQISTIPWGNSVTDIAVQGDYDADGKTDIAIWRSSGWDVGYWYIRKSSNGESRTEQWGASGDIPVPAPW